MEKDAWQKRAQDRIDMNNRNLEYEKKVSRAALGITHERDHEKEKLTSININKHTLKEDQRHLQKHLESQVIKKKSTNLLKTDLNRQMLEKRDVRHVQMSQDAEQLRISKRLDEMHWANE